LCSLQKIVMQTEDQIDVDVNVNMKMRF